LDLSNYSREELERHEQQHPLCEFCALRVYSGDDLFQHMRATHFTCDVCQRNGAFVYFDNANTLVSHLRYTKAQSTKVARVLKGANVSVQHESFP
jgi:hypothetical protein